MLGAVAPPESGDVARRAFYFGGLAHILEMDDLHRDSVTHPGCVVIPAAWAIAEDRDLGGHAFLGAFLAGYEACCRVGMSVGKAHYRIWHNTSTCGPFGSAMAAAGVRPTQALRRTRGPASTRPAPRRADSQGSRFPVRQVAARPPRSSPVRIESSAVMRALRP